MRKFLLTLVIAAIVGFSGCGFLKNFTGEDIADIIDIILDEETNTTVLADSLVGFIADGVPVTIDSVSVSVPDVNPNIPATQVNTSSSVVVIIGNSPVVVASEARTDVEIVFDEDPATEYTLTFVATPIREGVFKVSVVISGVEDVGQFVSFGFDSTVPNALRFDGVLPGTDGVTNGFAGVAANSNPNHYKYGRVGGYSSSLAPGVKSGVLVDMFYTGPIKFAYNVVYFNVQISQADGNYPPIASNPQIDPNRKLLKPSN